MRGVVLESSVHSRDEEILLLSCVVSWPVAELHHPAAARCSIVRTAQRVVGGPGAGGRGKLAAEDGRLLVAGREEPTSNLDDLVGDLCPVVLRYLPTPGIICMWP